MYHIVVGMSGGVDSSVAAAKLIEQGHKVTGLFMKNWEEDDQEEYCAAAEDLADAEEVCKVLQIDLETVNFSHEYWTRVFQIFLAEYRKGRTPNPDIICNKEIKFKEFLEWAIHLGADYIATGHYARLGKENRRHLLLKGLDQHKDQSYFLHTLDQEALSQVLFPIGAMNKLQVRESAKKLSLPVHDKKDSTGICFIGKHKFLDFIRRFLPEKPGLVKTLDGQSVGEHHGAFYYTIGQRTGLKIGGAGEAWYVVQKDMKRNIVYAVQGDNHPALMKKVVHAEQLHWISGSPPILPLNCMAKIRHGQKDQECLVSMIGPNYTRIIFEEPQRAVAPGQSLVFYQGDHCIGGGIIQSGLDR